MKNKMTLIILISCFFIVIISCKDDEDTTKEISKEGAVETVLSVDHLNDSLDLLHTSYNVWVKNVLVNKFSHTDTIPTLGTTVDKDEDGNETGLPYKKDYEFFITVK
jgi:hypothetical protein